MLVSVLPFNRNIETVFPLSEHIAVAFLQSLIKFVWASLMFTPSVLDFYDDIVLADFKNIYMVGEGHLTHDRQGFKLTGCDGKLEYAQPALACYGLYADYYWYELGDVICIGNHDALYYCFPKQDGVVAKTRIAAEEIYKMKAAETRRPRRRTVTAQ